MNPSQKVEIRLNSKVDFNAQNDAGSHLDLHEKVALQLARAYEKSENPDYVMISWANQVKAQDYFNEHGFAATLDHMLEVEKSGVTS